MKTQLKFQKILFLVSLIIAAASLVYGFGFCTESISYACKTLSSNNPFSYASGYSRDPINADALYQFVMGKGEYLGNKQWGDGWLGFNNLIVLLSIALIVIVALQYVFSTNSRRNYYISNYISVGVLIVFALVVAIVGFWGVSTSLSLFNDIDFEFWYEWYEVGTIKFYTESRAIFYIGYVVFALVLVDAVLLVLNTVWKVLLMRGEKALLNGNKTVDASDNLVKEGA